MARRFLVSEAITAGSGTASRPPNPFVGVQHWRTDKNFMETYDGTNWKVFGTVAVAALTDITTPYTGQCVIHTGDYNRQYVYDGSTWIVQRYALREGGEYRVTTGTGSDGQTTSTGSNKILLGTTVKAVVGPGLTWTGGSTSAFTTTEDGVWAMSFYAKVIFPVTGNNYSASIGPSGSYVAGNMYTGDNFLPGTTDVHVSTTRWLVSGSTISGWLYCNANPSRIENLNRPATLAVWRVA